MTSVGVPARDLAGYADQWPAFEWPGGNRLAVNFVINYEEGAEHTPLDGDDSHELLTEARYEVPRGERELMAESTFEYGSRVGIWRVLNLFDEYTVAPTIFGVGQALERNPRAAAALVQRGCDFVGHGYRWDAHGGLTYDQEAEQIKRCADSIRETTGHRIIGWFTRPPATTNTRRILAEQGFLYDSHAVNDDIPYFDTVAGRPFLVVPYAMDINDTKYYKNQFFTARDFAEYAIDSFETLYAESAQTPRMLSIGLHSRIIGRPGRIVALRRLLEHVTAREGVWIAGRDQIAQFWAATFGPAGLWNWK